MGPADLAGDFDLRSPMDVQRWYTREWQVIADVLGFAQQFAATPTAIPTTSDRVTAINLVGLAAFERSLRAVRSGVPAYVLAGDDAEGDAPRTLLDILASLDGMRAAGLRR